MILGSSGFGVVSQNFSVPVPNLSHFTFAAISATCMSVCPSCSDAHSDPRQEGALGERLRGPNFCGHVAGTVQGDTPRPHSWGGGRRCTCCARLSAEGSGRAGPRDARTARPTLPTRPTLPAPEPRAPRCAREPERPEAELRTGAGRAPSCGSSSALRARGGRRLRGGNPACVARHVGRPGAPDPRPLRHSRPPLPSEGGLKNPVIWIITG